MVNDTSAMYGDDHSTCQVPGRRPNPTIPCFDGVVQMIELISPPRGA